jgi:acyl-CoA reductase-like NAD-dependent aldehyde dehydrogenase
MPCQIRSPISPASPGIAPPGWRGKKLLIGGQQVPALGRNLASHAASTGELVAELALAGPGDVDRAVQAARAAFEAVEPLQARRAASRAEAGRAGGR